MEAGAFFLTALLLGSLGGWEIMLILAVVLALFGVKNFPDIFNCCSQGIEEFKKTSREVIEGVRETIDPNNPPRERTSNDEFFLWIAQGFDIGRIPIAPGTFGTLVGLLWFAVLLVPGSPVFYLAGTVFGFALSIWLCGEAERILDQRDPGSVILDEITALPVCFLPWVSLECIRSGDMPPVETFFTDHGLLLTGVIFVLFRIFDIAKPWPIAKSQFLPGGLGVTADDFLAAIYVALISLLFVA
jgi:phosphatidylglycerophosphatase A